MNGRARGIIVVLCCLAAALPAAAAGSGTTAANFLKIAVGARPAGMGEAFTAVADETSGMFYNPAGPAFMRSPEVQAMHALWVGDLSYTYLGWTQPVRTGALGLGLQYLGSPATPKMADGVRQGDFNYYDAAANLFYATRLTEYFSVGGLVKGVQSQIDANGASAVSGDCGMLFRTPGEGFSFGVAGQNLTGELGSDKLPATYRAGVAFSTDLNDRFSRLLFALEAGQAGTDPMYYAAGIEHWGGDVLGLRIGYKFIADEKLRNSLDALAPWRAGFSLRFRTVALDYAYQPFAGLGEAHRLSLTWRAFGWNAAHQRIPMDLKADPKVFSPNNDGAKDSVFFVPEVPDVKEVRRWSLAIQDETGAPIKTFSGRDKLPRIVSWEGQSDAGVRMGEGKYQAQFTAQCDGRKFAQASVTDIIADVTPPAVSLQISNGTLVPASPLANTTTFYVSATDLNGMDEWTLNIISARGKTVRTFSSSSDKPVSVVWDGTDDFYGTMVPPGTYTASLVGMDAAGNRARTTQQFSVSAGAAPAPARDVQVQETNRGLVINLSSQVLFDAGKAQLRPAANKALTEVVAILQAYPENQVLIEGHTDATGSREKNTELSSTRAWNVYSFLVKQGVQASRLKPKGYGSDRPVGSNKTAVGRAQNRRVEIIVLKK